MCKLKKKLQSIQKYISLSPLILDEFAINPGNSKPGVSTEGKLTGPHVELLAQMKGTFKNQGHVNTDKTTKETDVAPLIGAGPDIDTLSDNTNGAGINRNLGKIKRFFLLVAKLIFLLVLLPISECALDGIDGLPHYVMHIGI